MFFFHIMMRRKIHNRKDQQQGSILYPWGSCGDTQIFDKPLPDCKAKSQVNPSAKTPLTGLSLAERNLSL